MLCLRLMCSQLPSFPSIVCMYVYLERADRLTPLTYGGIFTSILITLCLVIVLSRYETNRISILLIVCVNQIMSCKDNIPNEIDVLN